MRTTVRIAIYLWVLLWWVPSDGFIATSSAAEQKVKSGKDRACSPSVVEEPQSERIFRVEKRFRERINEIRKEHGLDPLQPHEVLRRAARGHSCRMAQEEFFSHTQPSGETVVDRVREAGLKFNAVGENIGFASNVADLVEMIVKSWMNSEGHRENILHDAFTHTGIGVREEGQTVYITQVFAGGIDPPDGSQIRSSKSENRNNIE